MWGRVVIWEGGDVGGWKVGPSTSCFDAPTVRHVQVQSPCMATLR